MKIALVSDIHGNLAALEAVFADAHLEGVDQIVNLGDSLSGPLLPLQTAQFLMSEKCLSIAGNHERQLLACDGLSERDSDGYARSQLTNNELNWLRSLPATACIGDQIFLCHGTPTNDHEYFLETVDQHGIRAASLEEILARSDHAQGEIIACGHSHIPRSIRLKFDQWIVNPGSVGLQAYSDDHLFHHKVENNSPDARYAIIQKHAGIWKINLKSIPYHHASMAQLAKLRHRPDWEIALLTGATINPMRSSLVF